MQDLAKRVAGTPLSDAEHKQRVDAAQARVRRIAIARVIQARRTGHKLVYRGAPVPDFKPQNRSYAAVYVTPEKGMARDYAQPKTIDGRVLEEGSITAYGFPKSARLVDVTHLIGDPDPRGDMARIERRHALTLEHQIWKTKQAPSKRRGGRPQQVEMTPSERWANARRQVRDMKTEHDENASGANIGLPSTFLQAAHTRPYPGQARFLRRLGYAGTQNGRSYALAAPDALKPLYSRDTDTRKITLAKHEAGTPLSEAEHQQRVDAARARWAGTVAAGAGGAVGGAAIAAMVLRRRETAAKEALHQALTVARAARIADMRRSDARVVRHTRTEASVTAGLRPSGTQDFLDRAVRGLRTQRNRTYAAFREVFDATAEDVVMGTGETFRLSATADGAPVRRLDAMIADIRENGRPSSSQIVSDQGAKASEAYSYERKAQTARARWEPTAHEKLTNLMQAVGLPAPGPSTAPASRGGGRRKRALDGTITTTNPVATKTAAREFERLQAERIAAELPAGPQRERFLARFAKSQQKRAAKRGKSTAPSTAAAKTRTAAALGEHQTELEYQLGHEADEARGFPPGEMRARVHELLSNVKSLDDIERLVRGMSSKMRDGWLAEHLLPSMTWTKPKTTVNVPGRKARAGRAYRLTRDGYPDRSARARLSKPLIEDVQARSKAWHEAERKAAVWRAVKARMAYRATVHAPKAAYDALRSARYRGTRIGGAALLGGLGLAIAAYLKPRADPALGKAADPDKHRQETPFPELQKAAPRKPRKSRAQVVASTETEVGQRLATEFARLKDTAAAKLEQPDGTSLHDEMLTGFDHALQPLTAAAEAGAAEPMDGGDASIAFTLAARSPYVTTYIDQYREDKVAELADEQRDTLKATLIQAAREGASPDVMARRIRETIGLTQFQSQHVLNYRAELETLNPGALQRDLRDRRFDKPIDRAIAAGTALSADQVDRYVDAYHRRYLAYRAMTIARTEGVSAANNGQQAAVAGYLEQNPGFTVIKTWIATDDERTRHDHAELNGQEVLGLDTPFICASGDTIRYPHDPEAPARQVIRCRCSWSTRLVKGRT